MHESNAGADALTQEFLGYLDTHNAALAAHCDEYPYKQLVRGGEALLDGNHIGVGIYKKDPKAPHDFFTIKLEDGAFHFVSRGKQDTAVSFRTPESRLREVAENRDQFITDPEQLDLDWLKRKLGLQS